MGEKLGLRDKNKFSALWVIDFPLLEWSEETKRYHAMHHPFTSPKPEDIGLLDTNPGKVRANAYDMVINGTEVGGGSIRIHDRPTQQMMFTHLGFSEEEARKQFGFLMEAFEFGAPPHGGIAFGFDRLCSIFGGADSIRDFIAFPTRAQHPQKLSATTHFKNSVVILIHGVFLLCFVNAWHCVCRNITRLLTSLKKGRCLKILLLSS
jgi:aspartyl-tRNA synthetase